MRPVGGHGGWAGERTPMCCLCAAALTSQHSFALFSATWVVSGCRSFDTKAGEWHNVQLPFDQFIPLFRAKTVKDGSKLDPSTVTSIQVSNKATLHQQRNRRRLAGLFLGLGSQPCLDDIKKPQQPSCALRCSGQAMLALHALFSASGLMTASFLSMS